MRDFEAIEILRALIFKLVPRQWQCVFCYPILKNKGKFSDPSDLMIIKCVETVLIITAFFTLILQIFLRKVQ